AVAHTFSTVATGGFSPRAGSVGEFGAGVQAVIIVFMILGGINFALYYQLLRGRPLMLWRDTELRFLMVLLLVGAALIIGSLYAERNNLWLSTGEQVPATLWQCTLNGLFQAVSIITTTGFVTSDFNYWPFL